MKSRTRIFAAVLLAGFVALGATTAYAATITSTTSGNWNDTNTWVGGVVPGTGDDAIIAATHTVHVTDTRLVGSVTIQDSNTNGNEGTLELRASGNLKIEDASGLDMETALTYHGQITFTATSGTAGVLIVADDMTAAGPINVTGSTGGTIQSNAAGDILTISGTLTVSGGPLTLSAAFTNTGTIQVTGNYQLLINTYGPEAASSGEFKVNSSTGTMKFGSGAGATITGNADFTVANGTLHFDVVSVETDGGLKQTGGVIQVDAGLTFKTTGPWNLAD